MKNCPKCNTKLEGELIFKTFFRQYNGDKAKALATAEQYGATERKGRWGLAIEIYDRAQDRTCAQQCPECQHRWPV